MASDNHYDVAIIGGGVVGCSVLFELTRQGYSCVLCEKNSQIMSEASAGNSGMLHTGFDAPLHSLEMQCIDSCQSVIFDVLHKFDIPYEKCGCVLVAWSEQQKKDIPILQNKILESGLPIHCAYLSPTELHKQEPFLRSGPQGALYIPDESVVDSSLLGIALAHHAWKQGAQILLNCEVTSFCDKILRTSHGQLSATVTINCTGLYGDLVDSLAGVQTFSIKPRKGQYCVFPKSASSFLKSIIFPMPTEKTKGIALFKTVYNNVMVGPTAEDVPERTRPRFDPLIHESLLSEAQQLLPDLCHFPPIGHYTGVRPATQFKDYQIKTYPQKGWISVGGIRSTGVSASLGIAQYVAEQVHSDMGMEPSRGGVKQLKHLHRTLGGNGCSVLIDGQLYPVSHPIYLYGQQNNLCKL